MRRFIVELESVESPEDLGLETEVEVVAGIREAIGEYFSVNAKVTREGERAADAAAKGGGGKRMVNPNKGAKGVARTLNLPREERATPFTDWLLAEVKAGRTPDGLDAAVEQYMKLCAEKGE